MGFIRPQLLARTLLSGRMRGRQDDNRPPSTPYSHAPSQSGQLLWQMGVSAPDKLPKCCWRIPSRTDRGCTVEQRPPATHTSAIALVCEFPHRTFEVPILSPHRHKHSSRLSLRPSRLHFILTFIRQPIMLSCRPTVAPDSISRVEKALFSC